MSMEEVYDLYQHTHCVFIYMGKIKIGLEAGSTSTFDLLKLGDLLSKYTCITYDKQKINILSWGDKDFKSDDQDDILIDRFTEKLYQVFKKDKDNWNQEDLFLLKAVSDFMRLLVEELMKKSDGNIKDMDAFHYVLVVPSEWDEDIREVLLRPMFVQSNLISQDDHKDRLVFYSDVESICCSIEDTFNGGFYLEREKNIILCRLSAIKKGEILIKLNLVSNVNSLFDFSNMICPKVVRYNPLVITTDDIICGIRAFIDTKISIDIQEEIMRIIMETNYNNILSDTNEKEERTINLKKPIINDTSKWELDKNQEVFMRSICLFDICAEIDQNLLNWSKYMLEYNRISFNAKNVTYKSQGLEEKIDCSTILLGAKQHGCNTLRNSAINSKVRIIPVQGSVISSSVFLDSGPDAIITIDISLDSTLLSLTLLDENGVSKEIFSHDYFIANRSLNSLGSFFRFSEVTTLDVNHSFIKFAEEYLMGDISDRNEVLLGLIDTKIESIFHKDGDVDDLLASTQQHIYIKAFILLYMIYLKNVISSKLSAIVESYVDFQDAVIKILKEITEDVMIEEGINIPHYVIPKSLNQLLQPVLQQQPFSYKEFRKGVLRQVCSENYGYTFMLIGNDRTVFPFLKKGDAMIDCQTKRIVYLNPQEISGENTLYICYSRLRTLDGLNPDGTVSLENISEDVLGTVVYRDMNNFSVGQYIPVAISIRYEADGASLCFGAKVAGERLTTDSWYELAAPVTLSLS
ncbi:hypothetical protein INT48_003612 [Thamnidium elegans]|uniref:Uncharacterized protein n=1 Tax=Thamnidium elegans TaxID=101142 RepID=A0A8H7SQJ1_9FUNG|nr:hypothetical protein INT48_003612 [Thamnidium elegans]